MDVPKHYDMPEESCTYEEVYEKIKELGEKYECEVQLMFYMSLIDAVTLNWR